MGNHIIEPPCSCDSDLLNFPFFKNVGSKSSTEKKKIRKKSEKRSPIFLQKILENFHLVFSQFL